MIVWWVAVVIMLVGWSVESRSNNPYWKNCCRNQNNANTSWYGNTRASQNPEIVVQASRNLELPVAVPVIIKKEEVYVLPSYEDVVKTGKTDANPEETNEAAKNEAVEK